jgi:hypothetical protein
MRKRLWPILLLAFLMLANAAHAQFAARYNFQDFTQNNQPVKAVYITPLWNVTVNNSTNIVVSQRQSKQTDSVGSLVVSNMVYGGYLVEFIGPTRTNRFTNCFDSSITAGTLVNAADYICVGTNATSSSDYAYTRAQANARFSTNVTPSVVGYVATAVDTSGHYDWEPGGGSGGGITLAQGTNIVNGSTGVIQTNGAARGTTFQFSTSGSNVIDARAVVAATAATNAYNTLLSSNLVFSGGSFQPTNIVSMSSSIFYCPALSVDLWITNGSFVGLLEGDDIQITGGPQVRVHYPLATNHVQITSFIQGTDYHFTNTWSVYPAFHMTDILGSQGGTRVVGYLANDDSYGINGGGPSTGNSGRIDFLEDNGGTNVWKVRLDFSRLNFINLFGYPFWISAYAPNDAFGINSSSIATRLDLTNAASNFRIQNPTTEFGVPNGSSTILQGPDTHWQLKFKDGGNNNMGFYSFGSTMANLGSFRFWDSKIGVSNELFRIASDTNSSLIPFQSPQLTVTNLGDAANTNLVYADKNGGLHPLSNGTGFLTNNGAGGFGLFPFASLPGASSGGNYSTNSDGSFVFSGPGVFNSAFTNKSVTAGSMVKVDANQKEVPAVAGTDYLTPGGNGSALTSLTAANLTGTVPMANLSTNVITATNQPFVVGQTLVYTGTNANGQPVFKPTTSFATNSDGSFVFSGPGTISGAISNSALSASADVETDANKKLGSTANAFGVKTNDASGNRGYNNKPILDLGASTNVNTFDSLTNTFSGTTFWLGTNQVITSATNIYLTTLGNPPVAGIERFGQLTIRATADITVTNATAGWRSSDMVSTRTLTNGNTMVIAGDVILGVVSNLAIVQFH